LPEWQTRKLKAASSLRATKCTQISRRVVGRCLSSQYSSTRTDKN